MSEQMTALEKVQWLIDQRAEGRFKCQESKDNTAMGILFQSWVIHLMMASDSLELIPLIEGVKDSRMIGQFRCEIGWEDDDMSTMLNQIIIEIRKGN